MKHIWIIDKNQSSTLFYRNYSDFQIDPDLVSGLLSALSNFSETEFKQTGIESVNMSGLEWVYLNDHHLNIMLIAADAKGGSPGVMLARLEVIKNMFVQAYNLSPEFFKKLVDVSQFNSFAPTVDMLREQWKQAEKAMDAAALFDILGVFQQIYNLFLSITKNNFFGQKYQLISKEIAQFSEKMEQNPDFKANPELSNISFDEQQGWNVITLNPIMLDKMLLTRYLFMIMEHLRFVLEKNLGFMITLNTISKEIIPYILSNWELLEKLELTKNLLDICLLRGRQKIV